MPEFEQIPELTPPAEETPAGHRSGFVSLIGRSNVGKSTLLNRLVGSKVAIVSEVPQTTRRTVKGIRTYGDAQVVYMDTPGIHKPRYMMNQRMVADAMASLEGVDLLLLMVDGEAGLGPGDRFVMKLAQDRSVPVFLVVNKTDRMAKEEVFKLIEEVTREFTFQEVVPVSALTGDNVDRLESIIRGCLPLGPRYFPGDKVTDAPEKFLLAEILREKIILNTRQELPHSSAVLLERMEETPQGLLKMDALVVVEKDSQKGILIGHNGEMMKRIASAARIEMEARLGTKVFLQVWVKVARNWRMDERFLDHLGVENLELPDAMKPDRDNGSE
jgi:GTP-binding protein Era